MADSTSAVVWGASGVAVNLANAVGGPYFLGFISAVVLPVPPAEPSCPEACMSQ